MLTKHHWYRSLYLVLAIAFALRLLTAFYWESKLGADQTFRFGDSAGYWNLASRIAHGEPYQYNSEYAKVFRTPGYPIFLAPLFWIWDEPPVMAARFLGAMLGTISVWLIWLIANELFDRRSAMFATWIATLYPGGIATSLLVLAEALFVPLMLAQFLFWVLAIKSSDRSRFWGWGAASGLMNGLACLTRPSWILFVPFLMTLGLVFFRKQERQLRLGVVVLIVSMLVMMPWWIRNYGVCGKFVLTSLQTGTSLYDGLNPDATGASDMAFAPVMKKSYQQLYFDKQLGPDYEFEYSFNEEMKARALRWSQQHPWRVVELAGIKFFRIWNPWPNSQEMGSALVSWGIALFFIPMVLLGFCGFVRSWGSYLAVVVCLLPTAYFTCLHMVFVGSIRYRHPPMMTFLILSAVMLAAVFHRRDSDQA